MTRDEKIKDIEKDIYESKIDLSNIVYKKDNISESIEQTYLNIIEKEIETNIKNLYNNYMVLNNQKLLSKTRRRR